MTWSQYSKSKIIPPEQLNAKVELLRKEGKKIATINGSFDLLHAGHLYILYEAAKQGDVLLVALNTDRSIQEYKSPLRPIISLQHRLEMITALNFVTYATWFDETDPCRILDVIKPHVHVNGAEYGLNCIEAPTVIANGGKIHIVDRIPSLSTSEVLQKISTIMRSEKKGNG